MARAILCIVKQLVVFHSCIAGMWCWAKTVCMRDREVPSNHHHILTLRANGAGCRGNGGRPLVVIAFPMPVVQLRLHRLIGSVLEPLELQAGYRIVCCMHAHCRLPNPRPRFATAADQRQSNHCLHHTASIGHNRSCRAVRVQHRRLLAVTYRLPNNCGLRFYEQHQKLEKQCGVVSWSNIARHRVPVQLNSVRVC